MTLTQEYCPGHDQWYLRGQECLFCVAGEPFWYPVNCPECGGPPDERTRAGMKCGRCAYDAY